MTQKDYDEFDLGKFDDGTGIPDQEQIKQRIFNRIERKRKTRSMGRYWWVAAASLIAFSGYYFMPQRTVKTPVKLALEAKPAINPGTNKAILILGNGGKIDLNAAANGRIAAMVDKVGSGRLVYEKNDNVHEITYNTIVTPRGGQYQVVLADGTRVWLNAASSLKFPTAFTGTDRHVELTGEAYFEVAKNKDMPFTVSAGNVRVNVLGTSFNVSAYEDDAVNKTTLLEGSVQIVRNNQRLSLAPGQQAVSEGNDRPVQLKTVNVEDAIAWKNGYFSFKKEDIRSVMRKIARWYDVDVTFQGDISNGELGGSVSRTQNIGEILSYLELTGIAHFKIEARTIVVKGN